MNLQPTKREEGRGKREEGRVKREEQWEKSESLSILKQPHGQRKCCETFAWVAAKELQEKLLSILLPLLPAVIKYSFSLSSHPGQCIPLGSITTDSTPWQISSRHSVKPFLISSYIVAEHNNCPDISFNNYLISVKFSAEYERYLGMHSRRARMPQATLIFAFGNLEFLLFHISFSAGHPGFYGLLITFLRLQPWQNTSSWVFLYFS